MLCGAYLHANDVGDGGREGDHLHQCLGIKINTGEGGREILAKIILSSWSGHEVLVEETSMRRYSLTHSLTFCHETL